MAESVVAISIESMLEPGTPTLRIGIQRHMVVASSRRRAKRLDSLAKTRQRSLDTWIRSYPEIVGYNPLPKAYVAFRPLLVE